MTIIASHVGPVSGLTHFHLLRESAAVRAKRPIVHGRAESDAAREADARERYSSVEIASGIDWPFEEAKDQPARSR
jgi:hypothetical protein